MPSNPHPDDPVSGDASSDDGPGDSGQQAGQTPREPDKVGGAGEARRRKRQLRKKILVSLLVGLVTGGGAFWLYNSFSPGELPAPSYATVDLNSSLPLYSIGYSVDQGSQSATIKISVEVYSSVTLSDSITTATLEVLPPNGTGFQQCKGLNCGIRAASTFMTPQQLTFTTGPRVGLLQAQADFSQATSDFGDAANGLDASAAMPQVSYQCTCSSQSAPTLQVRYNLPGAGSYDWSSFPTQQEGPAGAIWQEPLATNAETPGRVATGIDPRTQRTDNRVTFIAGALVGVAASALFEALMGALRVDD